MISRRKAHVLKDEWKFILGGLVKSRRYPSKYINEWEKAFACYIGAEHAIAVSSGRIGMELILKSLCLDAGCEVIIPAYTLKDLIGIIRSMGLVPIPADISPKTFNINPHSILQRITKKTKVILATHMFGVPCDIDKILQIAKSKSIYIVEDCAHSAGSKIKGRMAGSFGDAAFFSFEAMKPINTYGGGMVVTNNKKLSLKICKYSGQYKSLSKIPVQKIFIAFFERFVFSTPAPLPFLSLLSSQRWNSKIAAFYRLIQRPPASTNSFTAFQAFIGLKKIKTLNERIKRRQDQANLFKLLLKGIVEFQEIRSDIFPNYYFFVALLPKDKVWQIRKRLLMHGIDAGIESEITDNCGELLSWNDCCNAKKIFKSAIQLPLHEAISTKHIFSISKLIKQSL